MALRLNLVLFVLLTTCTSMSDPTSKRYKFKNETNPRTMSSQSTSPTSDIKNQTLPSRSGMCNLTVDQSVLTTISELTHDSTMNLVELQMFVGSENESRLLPDVKWAWANNVGREIMLIIKNSVGFNLLTLTVGRIKLAVQIYENPQGCIASKKNGTSFVAKTLLQKLFPTSNTEYQLCYGGVYTEYTCCKIIHKSRQRECRVYSSYLTDLIGYYLKSYLIVLPFIAFPLLMPWFLESSRERKYYKVTGSPLSLSSIIYFVFFEGYGPIKSFFRRLIFIGLVLYIRLRIIGEGFFNFSDNHILVFFDALLVYWAVLFPFSDVFKNNNTPALETFYRTRTRFSIYTRYLLEYASYDLENVFVSGIDYENIVNVLVIFFNLKRWQRSLNKFFHEEELGFAKKCWYYFKAVLFSFVYIVGISFILLLLIIDTLLSYVGLFWGSLMNVKRQTISHRVWYYIKRLHAVFLTLSIFLFSLYLCSYLPYITLLFFAGLILNAVYFSPYVTFITILIFYSWTFWQDVETKYSTLKMQIYEVCKDSGLTFGLDDGDNISFDGDNISFDRDNISFDGYRPIPDDSVGLYNVGNGNDGGDDNHHSNRLKSMTKWKYNRNNEPMISRQFYDRIREKILPYNLILFNFFIKVFFVCLFAYFLFTIVRILNTANISGTVKVITTMSVSVVPHIFNVVAAKNSEEEKKKEVQKNKVKKLVCELTEGTDQVHQIYMEMSDDEK